MIELREVKIEDAEQLYETCKDHRVAESLTWYEHESPTVTRFMIRHFFLDKEKYGIPNSFAIILKETNKVIGIADYHMDGDLPTVGYFLNYDYWNKGIMSKALDKLLDIGFNQYNFEVIQAKHRDDNFGSEKVILKNGFKYVKDEYLHCKGKDLNLKTYLQTRSEYNDK